MGRMMAQKLAGEEEITEFFLLRDLNHFCTGCYRCIEDETACPFYAEKKLILEAMEQSDLLIFTTPTYCMAPSASMKALLDLLFDCWMVHRPKAWMFQKRAVVLSTAAGGGSGAAIKGVRQSLRYWGVSDIKGYGANLQAMNWEMVKEQNKQKVERDLTRLAKRIKRKNFPKTGIKTRALFFVMRGMHAAGWDSSPVEKRYWQERGWLGKDRPWRW